MQEPEYLDNNIGSLVRLMHCSRARLEINLLGEGRGGGTSYK